MILVDANLLVYARATDYPQHNRARRWLDDQLNSTARIGLPWPSLLAFVRVVTNPRVFSAPETTAAAWRQVEEWLDVESAWVPAPTRRHREVLAPLMASANHSNHVPDAHLAALAVEHGLTLATTDGDFGRFPGLRWENPLSHEQGEGGQPV